MKYNQQESKWQHSDDCLFFSPLATGRGYWDCTCGYDAYLEATEDSDDFEAENDRLRAELDEARAEGVRLQVELKSLNRSVDFYQCRVNNLEKLALAGMPEPWVTLCFDIIANGRPRDWGVGEFLKEQA